MKIKKIISNPLLILFFINVVFFFPLFFPYLKLIITPEYGGGDENIFHYPIKYLFQQKIKQGKLLIWAKNIGGGYPVFALGEVGLLNPINIITLLIFPFNLAINLQIFFSFIILLFSSYWLGRVFKLKKITSIFLATTFSYSFFILTNIIHLSHLASFVYIPAIFAITVKMIKNKNKIYYLKNYLILTALLTIQIISGHLQYVLYSFILIYGYIFCAYIFSNKKEKKVIFHIFLMISLACVFSLGLASFQLIPSFEYYKLSNRYEMNISNNSNSLSLINLLTFFHPFLSYNINLIRYSQSGSFIPPWDSNFYLGIFPLIILILGIRTIFKYKQLILLIIVLLLLAFNQNSPIYFINTLPPISLFRVLERITFLILLLISILTSYAFDNFYKKKDKVIKFFLVLAIFLNLFLNMSLMYKFHVYINPKNYFEKNEVIDFLLKNKEYRFLSMFFYDEVIPLNLLKRGIDRFNMQNFNLVKKSLTGNFNLLFDLETLNLPTSAFNLKRHQYFYNMLLDDNEMFIDRQETKTASLSAYAKNLFKISSLNYLLSPYKLIDPSKNIHLIKKYGVKSDDHPIYIYKTLASNNRFSFSNNPIKIATLNELKKNLERKIDNNIVFVEEDYPYYNLKPTKPIKFTSKIVLKDDEYLKARVNSNTDGILTLNDNYYFGWRAYIDGKETKIFRSNFLFRGIYFPKGSHIVEYKYQPESLKLGTGISFIFLIILLFAIIFLRKYPHFF